MVSSYGNFDFRKATHVIFDLDGVILDSELIYSEVYANVCAKYTKMLSCREIAAYVGYEAEEAIDTLIRVTQIQATHEEFLAHCEKEYDDHFKNSQLLPGVRELIYHFHAKGVPMALTAPKDMKNVRLKLTKYPDFLKYFHHVTLTTDKEVKAKKPDPSLYLVCASRFPDKPDPKDVLVFEDSIIGMESALAAGMQCVVVPDHRVKIHHFDKATQILTFMGDFRPEEFGFPPFD